MSPGPGQAGEPPHRVAHGVCVSRRGMRGNDITASAVTRKRGRAVCVTAPKGVDGTSPRIPSRKR